MPLLDSAMPDWHFRERHHTVIRSAPHLVWQAVEQVRADEIILAKTLFAIRHAPARLLGRRPDVPPLSQPIMADLVSSGFVPLGRNEGRELVVGIVGRFWTIAPQPVRFAPADFLAPRPGHAHAAMDMRVTPRPDGTTLLTTETRILIPDRGARVRFALYWTVVRGGSALLRRLWLRAIRLRAELTST